MGLRVCDVFGNLFRLVEIGEDTGIGFSNVFRRSLNALSFGFLFNKIRKIIIKFNNKHFYIYSDIISINVNDIN